MSLWISISEGFSNFVLLLDQLVLGVDIYLSIVLSVSVLFFYEVSTVSLDICDLSILSTVSIFSFSDIEDVLASLTTFSIGFYSLSNVSILVFAGVIDAPSLSFYVFLRA